MLGADVAKRCFSIGDVFKHLWYSPMQINFDIFEGVFQDGDKILLHVPKGTTYSKMIIDFEFEPLANMDQAQKSVMEMQKDNNVQPYKCKNKDLLSYDMVGEDIDCGVDYDN